MTSPDRSVPAGAFVGASGAGNSVSNLQKVTWESTRQAILNNVLGSFSGFDAAGSNLNNVTQKALGTATTAQSTATTAQATATSTQSAAASNAAVLAGLTAQQSSQQTGGTSFSDTFNRTTLGSGYNTFKTGPVADLVVANGQVQLNHNGDQNSGAVVALSTTTLQTDSQSVSIVLGDANNADKAAVGIYLRAAADLSTFVYAGIQSGNVYLGYGTRSGGTISYHGWTSGTATAHTGDTATVQANGSSYQVLINGVPVLGYTDSGNVSPVGAANRSFGFDGEYYWTGLFGYFPFAITGLSAADLASPTVTGTGWGLMRTNSAGATQLKGDGPVGAGTFDNTRQPPAGVTIANMGSGQVQITKSGWYLIDVGLYLSSQDTEIRAEVWTAASTAGPWSLLRAGATTNVVRDDQYTYQNGTDGSGNPVYTTVDNYVAQATSIGGSFVVYLQKGTLVAPGCKLNANNNFVGPNSYFDGALLNF